MKNADWLSAEPFTLNLGAGFFGFFAHTGLIVALEEFGLKPARVIGTSAGALAGGLWAAGVPLAVWRERLASLRRQEFWDPGPGLGLLRGKKFARVLEDLLPPEAQRIEGLPVPFTPVTHDVLRWKTRPLRQGPTVAAIRASCALPGLFGPVRFEGKWLLDGGILDRNGITAEDPGERVLLHQLPHHSPWPEFGTKLETRVPGGNRLVHVPQDLPKVNPFALERGTDALDESLRQARAWLEAPLAAQVQASA